MSFQKDAYKGTLQGHPVYVGLAGVAYVFEVVEDRIVRKLVRDLHCQHEEADTRIV